MSDQNACIDRVNRSWHKEVLNACVFADPDELRQINRKWLRTTNEERPHDVLGSLLPARLRALMESKNFDF